MTDEPANIVLEHLRRIDRKVDGVLDEMRHMNLRMGSIEKVLSGQYVADVDQNQELDRLKTRVDRIERRLELSES
jgi:tetrahydromethanopterin S-methyltransferase subunit G